MLDIQLLRTDIDAVSRKLNTRGYTLDVATFQKLENERKTLQTQTQDSQAKRNSLSKQVGMLKGKGEDASAASAPRRGAGCSTGIPRAAASCFTALSRRRWPRPAGRSGWV